MKQISMKPLAWFKLASQARRYFDPEELLRLGESLRQKQIQPLVAKPDGTIIAGERRFRAAQMVGLKELMVLLSEEPLSETEIRVLQMTENLHRSDLLDIEKFRACEELIKLNPSWNQKEMSRFLQLSESAITKYLSPLKCVPEVVHALEQGQIGITTCYELSRVEPEKQKALLEMKFMGKSRDEIAAYLKREKSSASSQPKIKRIACPLPSGVQLVASGMKLSLDDLIIALGEAQSAARKARDQGLDARTFSAVMKDQSRRAKPGT